MPTTEQAPGLPELQPAPYGYGISSGEGGVVLHTLATAWEARYWPGNPNSLWTEHRTGRWVLWAAARCHLGLDWKADPPDADTTWRLCPACQLSDAERLALNTRLDLPPCNVSRTAEQESAL